jgi:hypothetical protein
LASIVSEISIDFLNHYDTVISNQTEEVMAISMTYATFEKEKDELLKGVEPEFVDIIQKIGWNSVSPSDNPVYEKILQTIKNLIPVFNSAIIRFEKRIEAKHY